VNDQDTEAGLTAVGVAIPDGGSAVASAISVSMPTARYSRDRLRAWSVALAAAAAAIAADLDAA
jgi:DNA-binding IclR family transcriptional regulator